MIFETAIFSDIITIWLRIIEILVAKKKKGAWVRLVSSAGTGVFYVAKSSVGKTLALKKYDRKVRQHVLFKEAKMK